MDELPLDDNLTETLAHMLVPVQPPEEFRHHLRNGLQLASRQHAQRRHLRRKRMTWQNWWLGIVAFSASIAAGSVIAYVIRARLFHSA